MSTVFLVASIDTLTGLSRLTTKYAANYDDRAAKCIKNIARLVRRCNIAPVRGDLTIKILRAHTEGFEKE